MPKAKKPRYNYAEQGLNALEVPGEPLSQLAQRMGVDSARAMRIMRGEVGPMGLLVLNRIAKNAKCEWALGDVNSKRVRHYVRGRTELALKAEREKRGLSLRQIGREIDGVTNETIRKIENNSFEKYGPRADFMDAYARYLGFCIVVSGKDGVDE